MAGNDKARGNVQSLQVRHTRHRNGGLIVYPPSTSKARRGDDPAHEYVLVTGEMPVFKIVGSCVGEFAQQEDYWNTTKLKRPAYLVPQNALRKWKSGGA